MSQFIDVSSTSLTSKGIEIPKEIVHLNKPNPISKLEVVQQNVKKRASVDLDDEQIRIDHQPKKVKVIKEVKEVKGDEKPFKCTVGCF